MKKYIGFQKYKPFSDYKKYQFSRKTLVFGNIYLFRITKISIFNKYTGFQIYIPVSDYKTINFEGIDCFSEIYTCFGLQNYQFWRNTLVFKNISDGVLMRELNIPGTQLDWYERI